MIGRASLRIAIVAAAALVAVTAEGEVLIGVPAPTTGDMAWLGEQHQQALQAAAPEVEAAEKAVGDNIDVMIVDDYCNGEQATAAYPPDDGGPGDGPLEIAVCEPHADCGTRRALGGG